MGEQPLYPSPPASAATPAAAASTSRASAASRSKKPNSSGSNPSKKPRLTLSVPGRPLSADGEVAAAIHHLRAADHALATVIDAHEPPAFHCPHRPFHSLVRSILYQQLAFKAAASVYSRFLALLGGEPNVLPDAVLALTPYQLRQIGVSPRKASYLHDPMCPGRGRWRSCVSGGALTAQSGRGTCGGSLSPRRCSRHRPSLLDHLHCLCLVRSSCSSSGSNRVSSK